MFGDEEVVGIGLFVTKRKKITWDPVWRNGNWKGVRWKQQLATTRPASCQPARCQTAQRQQANDLTSQAWASLAPRVLGRALWGTRWTGGGDRGGTKISRTGMWKLIRSSKMRPIGASEKPRVTGTDQSILPEKSVTHKSSQSDD